MNLSQDNQLSNNDFQIKQEKKKKRIKSNPKIKLIQFNKSKKSIF